MKNLSLNNIARVLKGELKNTEGFDCDREATCVDLDSRRIEEGGIFIATRGEKVDGHTFLGQVAQKGAIGAIVEKDIPDCPVPYILVKDSFQALTELATYYRSCLKIPVIGITGSVGKTSTKEFVAGTLSAKYKVCKTQMNHNNEIGVPLTILTIQDDDEIAVVEMGISHFGEMSRLTAVVKPDTVVITNIGPCHLEFLGDRDGVLKAKTEIFEAMNPAGLIFLNGDDDKLSTVKKPYDREIVHFGMSASNEICAADIKSKGLLGSDATIKMYGFKIPVHVPLPGKHMVLNAMVAAGVAKEYKLTNEEIAKGIASVEPTKGRSHIVETSKYTLIDDCYNANPASMKSALDLLNMADTRKVAILGDMFELGSDEKALHSEVGEYAVNHGVDLLITIGNLSESMYEGALNSVLGGGASIYCFKTKEEAMDKLPKLLKRDDSILIKASHGMHLEEIVAFLSK